MVTIIVSGFSFCQIWYLTFMLPNGKALYGLMKGGSKTLQHLLDVDYLSELSLSAQGHPLDIRVGDIGLGTVFDFTRVWNGPDAIAQLKSLGSDATVEVRLAEGLNPIGASHDSVKHDQSNSVATGQKDGSAGGDPAGNKSGTEKSGKGSKN